MVGRRSELDQRSRLSVGIDDPRSPPPPPDHEQSGPEHGDALETHATRGMRRGDALDQGVQPVGSHGGVEAHFVDPLWSDAAASARHAKLAAEVNRLRDQNDCGGRPPPPPQGDRSAPVTNIEQEQIAVDSNDALIEFVYESTRRGAELYVEHKYHVGVELPPYNEVRPGLDKLHDATESTPEAQSASAEEMNTRNPYEE